MPNHFSAKNSRSRFIKRSLTIALILLIILSAAFFAYRFIFKEKKAQTRRDAVGQVTTLAGAGYPGSADGAGNEAAFSDPFGVAIDKLGNVIVADGGGSNLIRRITPQGRVETIAGSGEGFADGAAGEAKFNTPSGIALDKQGNLLIADTSNNRIRKLDTRGQVTTVAGSGVTGFKDGTATEAMFDAPIGVAVDNRGNIYVADTYNDRIRKISADGQVSTFAGSGVQGYSDGSAGESKFDTPSGLAVDANGNLYVADTGNNAVRKITPQGEVTTLAKDSADGGAVRLSYPTSLALTEDRFLFVASEGSGRVQCLTPEGEVSVYAGNKSGYADGAGEGARFNGAAGIAVDPQGNLYVADNRNYFIRKIAPAPPQEALKAVSGEAEQYLQPVEPVDANGAQTGVPMVPNLNLAVLHYPSPFPYPIRPQNAWHEIAGVVGEARGWFGGIALDHLHSGLDIAGKMGEAALSVMDEKVASPISTWGYDDTGEGIHVGLMSYIHVRIGRDMANKIQVAEKFKPRLDETGKQIGVRVRRGTRFKVGDFIGTLNRLYHVHMNVGPPNAQVNAIQFPFADFKDTIAPVIEPNGIEIFDAAWQPFKEKVNGRLVISGDARIVVTAYDRADGNVPSRKLGLFRAGYQILKEDGTPVRGFEEPLINIEFSRLPPDEAVKIVYADGSGVSAYGTPTKFKYIVTNRVRDGVMKVGLLRTSAIGAGNYILRIVAEDYAGNRASGKATEMAITVR